MISKQQQNMAILDDDINYTNSSMDEMPTNLSLDKANCDNSPQDQVISERDNTIKMKSIPPSAIEKESHNFQNETRIQLSFSVDRLLNDSSTHSDHQNILDSAKCCEEMSNGYSCCSLPNCLVNTSNSSVVSYTGNAYQNADDDNNMPLGCPPNFMDFNSVVRPTPIRAIGNNTEQVTTISHYAPLTPISLMRFHHAQMQQKQMHQHLPAHPNFGLSSLMNPLCGMKTTSANGQQMALPNFPPPNRFTTKSALTFDIPVVRPNLTCISNLRHHHLTSSPASEHHLNFPNTSNASSTGSSQSSVNSGNNTNTQHTTLSNGKRKRSWSRAVFSNLQRKGLEIQFQQQKYITKPDRRKLAARLNLTDAQVKVWFQNRRMKWRHTRENLKSGQEKQPPTDSNNQPPASVKTAAESCDNQSVPGYSSDGSSSLEMSEGEEDDDEIDVVE